MRDGLRERYPRFKKGEIVKMTREAIRANIRTRGSLYGVVTSTPQWRMYVNVRRVGRKGQLCYWAGFWRHLKTAEIAS